MPERNEEGKEIFPGNQYMNKGRQAPSEAEPPKKKKKSSVELREKTIGEKIADNFMSLASNRKTIGKDLFYKWILPGVESALENAIHIIFGGGYSSSAPSIRSHEIETVSYNSLYRPDKKRVETKGASTYGRIDISPTIIFDNESDALQVRGGMLEEIDDHQRASIKTFYSIVSEVTGSDVDVPNDWMMNDWGWYDFSNARITRTRDGRYMLSTPQAVDIRR